MDRGLEGTEPKLSGGRDIKLAVERRKKTRRGRRTIFTRSF